MVTILTALLPVFFIIILGYLFKIYQFPIHNFWPSVAKLAYYIFIPALLFNKLANTSLLSFTNLPMLLTLIGNILIVSLLLYTVFVTTSISITSFTSIYQGSTRFNVFIGLALSKLFFGPDGIAMAAVAILGLTPLINILCVVILKQSGLHEKQNMYSIVGGVLKNPIILSCLLGLLFNLSNINIPAIFQHAINTLDQAALPLGLLVVGSGLQLHRKNFEFKSIIISTFFKLALLPALTLSICSLFGIYGLSRDIALLFTALPTATSGYILSQELGGNKELMAHIITVQTLISFLSLPLIIPFFHSTL